MLEYIILGIVQGLTEFLPVSSSGHLVLFAKIFGISGHEVALSIVLHLGTLAAVAVFFFRDIYSALRNAFMLWYIVVVTLITGAIGITGKDFFESLFSSLPAVCIAWLCTGVLLLITKKFMSQKRSSVTLKDSIVLGVTQAIAIVPGISRSAMTISTLLFRGLSVRTAFSFSFIVSIPAILGATLLEAKKIGFAVQGNTAALSAGFIASLCAGLAGLWLLKRALIKERFHYFGYYCIGISLGTLGLLSFNLIR